MASDVKGPLSLETLDKLKSQKLLPDDIVKGLESLGGGRPAPAEFGAAPQESAVTKALNMITPEKGSTTDNILGNIKEGLSRVGNNLVEQSASQINRPDNPVGFFKNIIYPMYEKAGTAIANEAQAFAQPGYFNQQPTIAAEGVGASPVPTTPDAVAPQDLALQAQPAPTEQDIFKDMAARATGGVLDGYRMQQDAIMKGARAGMQQAAAESAYMQKMTDDLAKRRETEAVLEQERQSKMDEQMSKLNQSVDEFAKMPKTTQESFDKLGTGQKILTGIALFLGAAPNSTGQNKALTVMQDSLDRSIAAQKSDINNRETVLGRMRQTFGDERQAEAAARLAYINDSQIKLNQIASQYKGPQIEANARMLYGQLETAKQKEIQAFTKAAQTSQGLTGADQMTKAIMALPKELQKEAFQEKATLELIQNQETQLKRLFKDISEQQTVAKRLGRPLDSKSLIEKAEADIFPIVKAIVGERMTDADARILIKTQLPKLTDADDIRDKKLNDMIMAMRAKSKGSTPILNGFGIRPKDWTETYAGLKKL